MRILFVLTLLLSLTQAAHLHQDADCNCGQYERIKLPDAGDLIVENVGARHENDRAKIILMHSPGNEVEMANFHPASALFSNPVAWDEASEEHRILVKKFRSKGIKVILIEDVLKEGVMDRDGVNIEGVKLEELRKFAGRYLVYNTDALRSEFDAIVEMARQSYFGTSIWHTMEQEIKRFEPKISNEYQESYRQEILSRLSAQSLIDIVLNRPTVELHVQSFFNGPSGNIHLKLDQVVSLRPMMNLYFNRDQIMTTWKGVVLTRPSLNQRAQEPEILEFVLKKLNVPIAGRLTQGYTDGGDFIIAGDAAMHGVGLRSSEEAVYEMMAKDWYGTPEVAVVKDYVDHEMDRMHLDTVFNILDEETVIVLEDIILNKNQTRYVDVYQHSSRNEPLRRVKKAKRSANFDTGDYQLVAADVDFKEYITKWRGFKNIVTVSNDEQLKYAINFLNLGHGHIMAAYDEPSYIRRLKNAGIQVQTAKVKALTDGYGGIHCMTQVIYRTRPNENGF